MARAMAIGLIIVCFALLAMTLMPSTIAIQKTIVKDRTIENGYYVLDKYSRLNYQPYVLCPGEKDLRFLQDPHPLYVKEVC